MRIWHYELFPYLPDLQFKGQLRELVSIMRDWRDKGKTNHLLVNEVMNHPKGDLTRYFLEYENEYARRNGGKRLVQFQEFLNFAAADLWTVKKDGSLYASVFDSWHNKEYLRVCMANLYEKHFFGVGKSRISDEEWHRLIEGYKKITGEEYKI